MFTHFVIYFIIIFTLLLLHGFNSSSDCVCSASVHHPEAAARSQESCHRCWWFSQWTQGEGEPAWPLEQCHQHQQHLEEDCSGVVEAPCFLPARRHATVPGSMGPLWLDDSGILYRACHREKLALLLICVLHEIQWCTKIINKKNNSRSLFDFPSCQSKIGCQVRSEYREVKTPWQTQNGETGNTCTHSLQSRNIL